MSVISGKRLAAISMPALALALFAGSAPAHAGVNEGSHTFKMSAPSYNRTDTNGTFNGQVNMAGHVGRNAPMAWSFTTSPSIRAIAAGNMTCKAGHMQLPYSDSHPNVGVDYFWHSTVPDNRHNVNYKLWGNCTFRVKVSGRAGTANLGFRFNYSLVDGISRSSVEPGAGDAQEEAYSSDLQIAYDPV
ncbi:hypothetical protein [Streptomyces sp. LS1784]|uniref:hypothetical protein n=1 Tax=Streptomyces sp. LS1784 TaxID=2851533 RepID=UPI001CCD0666|nr:hypothetical protein [Streptomyces sp. LS1784]